MAKPQHLCFLREGKAIGAFSDFVATWNWLVSFVSNMKGEGNDEEPEHKSVWLDTTTDDHPVIRGGGGVKTTALESFQIVTDVQYDTTSHTIQKRVANVTVKNGKITEIDDPQSWTVITGGNCVPVPVS